MSEQQQNTQSTTGPLVDRFQREVNYLRISVTDRCDLRCVYCMSENMKFLPSASPGGPARRRCDVGSWATPAG